MKRTYQPSEKRELELMALDQDEEPRPEGGFWHYEEQKAGLL